MTRDNSDYIEGDRGGGPGYRREGDRGFVNAGDNHVDFKENGCIFC